MHPIRSVLAALLFAAGTGAALAADDQPLACAKVVATQAAPGAVVFTPAQPTGPMSLSVVWSKLVGQGYARVHSMTAQSGCIHATGIDKVGRHFEVMVNPLNGVIFDGKFARAVD